MNPSKRSPVRLLLLGLIFCLALGMLPAQNKKVSKKRRKEESEAAKYYQKWLNEDVVYIITEEERNVFNKLTTPEEKDRFIEQFWERRDTDLRTAVNEFREEHYRRIAYANQKFGSGIPGWKTDRGRVYIMFGEPAEIEYHPGGDYLRKPYEGGGKTATYPFEVWRYRHIEGVGDDVEIEFVDRSMSGEFKMALYPWEKDALLQVDGLGQTLSERLGLTHRNYRPGLHPGYLNNTNYMKKFMGARNKDRPFERLRQFFALQRPPKIHQKYLKTVVDTKISYTQLPFDTYIYYVWIDDRTAMVPITVKVPNKNLLYRRHGNRYKARVGIYGRISSILGRVEKEFEDVVASEYQARFLDVGKTQFSFYQKTFTLPPGRHKVELVVKDMGSGDLGTYFKSVHLVQPKEARFTSGDIILAKQLKHLDSFPDKPRSFVIGDVRVVPKVDRKFKVSDPLGVYLQVYNPTLDSSSLEPAVSVEYNIYRGSKLVTRSSDPEGSSVGYFSSQRLVLLKKMDLRQLGKGRYSLVVKVTDNISGQSSSSRTEFQVVGKS